MEVWEEIETNPERGSQRLIDEYGNRLYAAASVLCPDLASAEDLVFRTLAQAVRKIAQYRGRAPFFSWLYRIMLNFRRMDCRGKAVELVFAETLPEPPNPNMEAMYKVLSTILSYNTEGKAITEDDLKREQDKIQKLTDKYIAELDKACQAKEKELKTI